MTFYVDFTKHLLTQELEWIEFELEKLRKMLTDDLSCDTTVKKVIAQYTTKHPSLIWKTEFIGDMLQITFTEEFTREDCLVIAKRISNHARNSVQILLEENYLKNRNKEESA